MMRKFFFSRWKQFFIIMLIPLLLITGIGCIYLYTKNTTSSVRKISNSLELLNESLNGIMNVSAYQYDLLTYNSSLVLSLKKLLSEQTLSYTDIVFLNTLQSLLNASADTNNYIDSIYLYLDGYDSFLSSSDGLLTLENAKDVDWYKFYSTEDMQDTQIQLREFQKYSYDVPLEYLTLYRSMQNAKGVIVININAAKLRTALTAFRNSQNHILILDKNGHVLCSTEGSETLFPEENAGNLSYESNSSDAERIVLGHKTYLSQSLYNSDYEITLLSLLPSESLFTTFYPEFLLLLGTVFSNCILSMILAYTVTRRNFRQISHIIDTFSQAENGILPSPKNEKAVNDEYDVILNNVVNVFLNSSYLKLQLHEKQYKQELAEIAALQYQINPHFLFNTLQAIDFEALRVTGSSSTVNTMIQNLSDILKYSLINPLESVTLRKEIEYLKKYENIQHQRLGENFIVYYEIDDSLLNFYVLRLMLQPLVENSISHGVAALDSTGFIKVRAYQRNDLAHFVVVDNGIGMSKEETEALRLRICNESSRNIGLPNINRRLVLKYGPDSSIQVLSKKGMGTVISFHIPLSYMVQAADPPVAIF